MNPIFIAHLIADFLLQPTWLVKWKKENAKGIIVHALIHATILAALIIPQTFFAFAVISIIAFTHGIIDHIKISLPKKSFERAFTLDQIVHAVILLLAMRFLSFNFNFWNSLNGILILSILAFFSFGIGIWNLMHIKSYPIYNFAQKATRIFTVSIIFIAFFTLAILVQL